MLGGDPTQVIIELLTHLESLLLPLTCSPNPEAFGQLNKRRLWANFTGRRELIASSPVVFH
jgi:hypothetical protein